MFSDLALAREIPVRRWTAAASFTLQATIILAGLAYPLMHPDSLPPVLHPLFLPIASYTPDLVSHTTASNGGISTAIRPIVASAHSISFSFGRAPTQPQDSGPAIPPGFGVIGAGKPDGVEHSIVGDYARPMPTVAPRERPLRRSVMMEGNLIRKIEPQYPTIAKALHIEGAVMLKAIISREGTIENVKVESGHALLAQAALQAVRQWRYRPYLLNDEPIEVETEIKVNFVLQR
jgi:protein TonB